jgi:hypothetical protein
MDPSELKKRYLDASEARYRSAILSSEVFQFRSPHQPRNTALHRQVNMPLLLSV